MKTISLREFSLHASKYIKKLPIVLTQYNKPVASVIPLNKNAGYSVNAFDQNEAHQPKYPYHNKPMEKYLPPGVTIGHKPALESKWPTSYLGKRLSGRMASCPVCHESVPIEFSTKHYSDKHQDL